MRFLPSSLAIVLNRRPSQGDLDRAHVKIWPVWTILGLATICSRCDQFRGVMDF